MYRKDSLYGSIKLTHELGHLDLLLARIRILRIVERSRSDTTHAAAKAFAKSLVHHLPLRSEGETFRFMYLSGKFAERDTEKKLWFMQYSRTIKVAIKSQVLMFTMVHELIIYDREK